MSFPEVCKAGCTRLMGCFFLKVRAPPYELDWELFTKEPNALGNKESNFKNIDSMRLSIHSYHNQSYLKILIYKTQKIKFMNCGSLF